MEHPRAAPAAQERMPERGEGKVLIVTRPLFDRRSAYGTHGRSAAVSASLPHLAARSCPTIARRRRNAARLIKLRFRRRRERIKRESRE
jgi:hypothetical protein